MGNKRYIICFNSFFRILRVLSQKLRLEDKFSFALLARLTPGFVGADLMSLTREAALIAVNRYNTLAILPLDHFSVSMFSEVTLATSAHTNVERQYTLWLKRIWFLRMWGMHLAPILSCPKPLPFLVW